MPTVLSETGSAEHSFLALRARPQALKRELQSAALARPDSLEAREILFNIISLIWENEELPAGFDTANFVMLFKNKGSHNDPSKYRCIGLLNHAYKGYSLVTVNKDLPNPCLCSGVISCLSFMIFLIHSIITNVFRLNFWVCFSMKLKSENHDRNRIHM